MFKKLGADVPDISNPLGIIVDSAGKINSAVNINAAIAQGNGTGVPNDGNFSSQSFSFKDTNNVARPPLFSGFGDYATVIAICNFQVAAQTNGSYVYQVRLKANSAGFSFLTWPRTFPAVGTGNSEQDLTILAVDPAVPKSSLTDTNYTCFCEHTGGTAAATTTVTMTAITQIMIFG